MARSLAIYTFLTMSIALIFSMMLDAEKDADLHRSEYLLNVKDDKKGKANNKRNAQAQKKPARKKKKTGARKSDNKKKSETPKNEGKKPEKKPVKQPAKQTAKKIKGIKYPPKQLAMLNKKHMGYLKSPEKPKLVKHDRSHQHSQGEIDQAARELDQIILAALTKNKQHMNPRTSDSQFARRIYLDAAGRIPTAKETQVFLDNNSSLKRQELINDLLLREDYPSQMFNWLAEMMRVKDVNSLKGSTSGYQGWLMDQLGTNRPWDEFVSDMLTAEGNLLSDPASGWLLRDRGMPLDSLSNTLTTFMGANVACAQCHDHPFDDWSQRDFYELAAFFGATEVPDQDSRRFHSLSGEKDRGMGVMIATHIARVTTREKKFLSYPEDYAYDDARPGSKVTPNFPVMDHLIKSKHFSDPREYRKVFAAWMTHQDNEQFAATIANRLWRKAFGRAVMEPLTEMDTLDNADNPYLIRKLAEIMQRLDFDLMAFQRVIYNTQSYMARASIEPPMGEPYHYPGPLLRRMTAEQAWDSLVALVIGADKANSMKRKRHESMVVYDVVKPDSLNDLTKENQLSYKDLLMAARANQAKAKRLVKGVKTPKGKTVILARASEISQPARESHFLRSFGQANKEVADGGTTEGGIPQVLMLMNGKAEEYFSRGNSYVYLQAKQKVGAEKQYASMYQSFLGRDIKPSELSILKSERVSLQDLAWILLNTREFIFIQ